MALNESLPSFDDGSIYLMKGKTLNALMRAIIREIVVDKNILAVDKKGNNKVELKFQGPDDGDYMLVRKSGVMTWVKLEAC